MKRVLWVSVLLSSLAVVASSGAAVKPQTLNLLEVDTSFIGAGGFDENGNSPPKVGQGFVVGGHLYKWKGTKRGAHFGTLNAACTFMTFDPTTFVGRAMCTAVVSLPGGKLTVSGLLGLGNQFEIPIVGGTGAYAGARGYIHSKDIGGEDSSRTADRIVITG